MLKRLFCLGAALFMGSSAGAQTAGTESELNLADIRTQALEKKAVILDVREQSEWDDGHLKVAQLIPLSAFRDGQADNLLQALPKDVPVYCHCKMGFRAKQATEMLIKLGYDAMALDMKYEEIVESGFEEVTK